MRALFLSGAAGLGVLLLPALASSQTAPASSVSTAPPGVERSTADPVESFLDRTAERQRGRENAFARRGLSGVDGQLRALAATARIAPPGLGRAGATRPRLEAALTTETIQFLAAAGVRPGDVQRARAGGVDLFEAASAAIRGVATFDQQAALTSHVVVAEVVQARQAGGGDGFGSSIGFRVIDSLRGPLEPGADFVLRQASGAEKDVSSDLRPEVGERFLLLLSRDYYEQLAAEAGQSPMSGAYAQLLPGFLLRGDEVLPTVIGQPAVASLSAARTAARTLDGRAR